MGRRDMKMESERVRRKGQERERERRGRGGCQWLGLSYIGLKNIQKN